MSIAGIKSIRISPPGYKSLTELQWEDLPRFAVITGLNGTGKTQLLESIHAQLGNHTKYPGFNTGAIKIESADKTRLINRVAYFPSDWRLRSDSHVSITDVEAIANSILSTIHTIRTHPEKKVESASYGTFIQRLMDESGRNLAQLTLTDIAEKLTPADVYHAYKGWSSEGIPALFLTYFAHRYAAINRYGSAALAAEHIGPPPWAKLDEILEVAGLPYRVVPPSSAIIRYEFRLRNIESNVEIGLADLSSGEQIIVSSILWSYSSQEYQHAATVILLDEPDAHLHPSMTKQFMDVLIKVLVEGQGSQVIMTTHSPSTVALAPAGSVYVMQKELPRIIKSSSTNATSSLLTGGLIIMGPTSRIVLVEDEVDVTFYTEIYKLCLTEGLLTGTPPLVFVPASIGSGKDKKPGGRTVVQGWAPKLHKSGLDTIISGLIDRDNRNLEGPGIYVIDRYCIENYWVDPIAIYALLNDQGHPHPVEGVHVPYGSIRMLSTMDASALQSVVDSIVALVEPNTQHNLRERITVPYSNGASLLLPRWALESDGKQLKTIYGKVFTQIQTRLNIATAVDIYRRMALVPQDLVERFSAIQRSMETVPSE